MPPTRTIPVLIIVLLVLTISYSNGQSTVAFADSIRKASHTPELAYAVVSADSVYEMQALGVRKINTKLVARHQPYSYVIGV